MESHLTIYKFASPKDIYSSSEGSVKALDSESSKGPIHFTENLVPAYAMADLLRESENHASSTGLCFFFFFRSCKLHVFYVVLIQKVSNVPNLCSWIFHKWSFCMQAFIHINIYASIQINAKASVCICDENMHMHEHLCQGISP